MPLMIFRKGLSEKEKKGAHRSPFHLPASPPHRSPISNKSEREEEPLRAGMSGDAAAMKGASSAPIARPGPSPTLRTHSLTPAVRELSDLLQTGLDSETLRVLVQLCEQGVDPDALAQVVVDLRDDKAKRASAQARKA